MTIEIDHLGLNVGDYAGAKAFYLAALAPLRMTLLQEYPASMTGGADTCGIGADGKPFFWITAAGRTTPRVHLAFRAETREQVEAFYAAALAAGGVDNGAPGIRKLYHPDYYGAFVIDPEGHNLEAVCHKPA
ncbi:MAG: VOC family protein [Bauldia sp.]|nr:VOC family protein [Bauldia sp.]